MLRYLNTFLVVVILGFQACREPEQQISAQGGIIVLDSLRIGHTDPYQDSIIAVYKQEIEEEMSLVLVYSEHVMKMGTPEGVLNNYVADLVFKKGKYLYKPKDQKPIDFCLLNYGGLREPLPKGQITSARVYELLPFENEMVVVTITGQKTQELFDYLATSTVGMPVSGIRLQIRNNQPDSILIQGEKFDISRNHKILTSDYLAMGGDNMVFFANPENYELLGMRVRDAIIMDMKNTHARGETISSQLDGRITIVQ